MQKLEKAKSPAALKDPKKSSARLPIKQKKPAPKPMSNDEVEKVMENFMNKLFVSPNLLEDENLNFKIEKIFENQVFQKMVENANVLEDAGVISDSQNKHQDTNKKAHKEKSEDFDINGDFLDQKAIEKSELRVQQEDILPLEDLAEKKNPKELEENARLHDQSKRNFREESNYEEKGMVRSNSRKDLKKKNEP